MSGGQGAGGAIDDAPHGPASATTAAEIDPPVDQTESAISGAFGIDTVSGAKNDADRCPHDAPMMPPGHIGDGFDGIEDVLAEVDAILAGGIDEAEQFADAGWRRESMGARMVGGQMVKRFRWRRGARDNRQTYVERGYATLAQLSADEQERHERNRQKYTTHAARSVAG